MSDYKAKLTLLSTPIGNLGDITHRAIDLLKNADYFLVEDTRVFKELLHHLGISLEGKKIQSLHDHSNPKKIENIVQQIQLGQSYVLASDAGSPIVSDPAYPLVQACIEQNIDIDSCPGCSSLIVAMELSGLNPNPIHFYGFLPREAKKRQQFFQHIHTIAGSHYFFESPHRVQDTLEILANHSKGRVAVMRELTKKFQTVYRFKAHEYAQYVAEIKSKGEFVIGVEVVKGIAQLSHSELIKQAESIIHKGPKPRALAKLLSLITDRPHKEIYQKLYADDSE